MKKSYTSDKPTTENSKVVIIPRPPVAENADTLKTSEATKNLETQSSEDKAKSDKKSE